MSEQTFTGSGFGRVIHPIYREALREPVPIPPYFPSRMDYFVAVILNGLLARPNHDDGLASYQSEHFDNFVIKKACSIIKKIDDPEYDYCDDEDGC